MNLLNLLLVFNVKCEDCKWFISNGFCKHPNLSNTGSICSLAKINRDSEYLCGQFGKHFINKDEKNELQQIYKDNKQIFIKMKSYNVKI